MNVGTERVVVDKPQAQSMSPAVSISTDNGSVVPRAPAENDAHTLQSPWLDVSYLDQIRVEQQETLTGMLEVLQGFNPGQLNAFLTVMDAGGCFSEPLQCNDLSDTVKKCNDRMQKYCLRAKGTERQQMKTNEKLEQQRPVLLDALKTLDLITEKKPQKGRYKELRILAASESTMRLRIETAANDLEEKNIEITSKVASIRTGQRPLWAYAQYDKKESGEKSTVAMVASRSGKTETEVSHIFKNYLTQEVVQENNAPTINQKRKDIVSKFKGIAWPTETDLAQELFKKAQEIHEPLRKLTLSTVSAEMNTDGSRPTTLDVEKKAREESTSQSTPEIKGDILTYSNQPFIQRQGLEVQLHSADTIETCGPGMERSQVDLSLSVDQVARRFYTASKIYFGQHQV